MRPNDRDCELVLNILEDASTLRRRIEHFKVDEASFVGDASFEGQIAYDSLMMPVYTLVEDALHLSAAVMSEFPDYPWDEVRAFRNVVAHGYRRVSREIAWKVVAEDIPELARLLHRYAEASVRHASRGAFLR